eukprot:9838732-Heterocapsa_arctica.AAC.1
MAGLEAYCSRIDQLLTRCREKPTGGILSTCFYQQICRISQLARDIQDYDRMNDDDPDRTYHWLRHACNRALDKWRADHHREDYAQTLKVRAKKGT